MTDTREAADPFRELAKKNYAYVVVRMDKSVVREFFDGFLAHEKQNVVIHSLFVLLTGGRRLGYSPVTNGEG